MKMSEAQFKRWMTNKTKQYIWLITKRDPEEVKIRFVKDFTKWIFPKNILYSHAAACLLSDGSYEIYYRTDWFRDAGITYDILEKLIIHEVCHLVYIAHGNEFYTEYKKWSGDDYIERLLQRKYDGINDDGSYYVSDVSGLGRLV